MDTSEPEAISTTFGLGLSIKMYAPFATAAVGGESVGIFCLLRMMPVGPFFRSKATFQAAAVSFASPGRKTTMFGITRRAASCSIG